MKKISVIYWSGTGNTEAMAKAVAEGAGIEGTEVKLLNVSDASVEDAQNTDLLALGCPSMGSEVLEESEMEPYVESIEGVVSGKKMVLFGSYGWGNGEWMTDWKERMENAGADVIEDGLIINEEPDEDGLENCRALGKKLASV